MLAQAEKSFFKPFRSEKSKWQSPDLMHCCFNYRFIIKLIFLYQHDTNQKKHNVLFTLFDTNHVDTGSSGCI